MHLVLITSAIHTNQAPLSYTATRSFYSHAQRFEQTKTTIASIRTYIPNSYIVLLEATKLQEEYRIAFTSLVEHLYETHHDPDIYARTEGPYKGWGEASKIYAYLQSEHFQTIKPSLQSISKISGRYRLRPDFTFEVYPDKMKAHLKMDSHDHYSRLYMSNVFYTIPIALFEKYLTSLKETIDHPEMRNGIALEHVLPMCLVKNNVSFAVQIPMRVEGEYGCWGGTVVQ